MYETFVVKKCQYYPFIMIRCGVSTFHFPAFNWQFYSVGMSIWRYQIFIAPFLYHICMKRSHVDLSNRSTCAALKNERLSLSSLHCFIPFKNIPFVNAQFNLFTNTVIVLFICYWNLFAAVHKNFRKDTIFLFMLIEFIARFRDLDASIFIQFKIIF